MRRTIDVIEVPRDLLARYGGEPWDRVCAAVGTNGVLLRQIPHGDTTREYDRPEWVPPLDKHGKPAVYLPLGRAWLREIDSRAFLYFQNWISEHAFRYLPEPQASGEAQNLQVTTD